MWLECVEAAPGTPSRGRVALLFLLHHIEPNGEDDDQALDDELVESDNTQKAHAVVQHADQQSADDRAADLAEPPARLVPPMTTAAMASSSNIVPRFGEAPFRREARMIPAKAASTEMTV